MNDSAAKISALIMARNEEDCIADVVERTLPHADETIVVDGHSTDRTRELAEKAGARVIRDRGRGKGDGYRTGLAQASGAVVVLLDADGSHDPADIPVLTNPILAGRLDMVIASRWRGGTDDVHPNLSHFVRDFGGNLLSLVISWRFGSEITDCLNGFRAIRREMALSLGLC